MTQDYTIKTKVELLAEIERLKKELKKRKKYGLVWEEKPEEVVEMCKEKLPVLKEVKNKEIITDKDKLVNLLIEGDNYHALSVLNYTHPKKVDVIYIDPPYNTGNKDFIFNDHYVDREDAYRHSKWLAFMEKRLKLAKNLLKNTGVIFISIEDNEVAQLKLLMDNPNLFGENNFLACILWQKKYAASNDVKGIAAMHDYILVYQKSSSFKRNLLPRTERANAAYKYDDNDGRGLWRSDNLLVKSFSASGVFPIKNPNTGKEYWPRKGKCWRGSKETIQKWLEEGRIFFGRDAKGAPQLKRYLSEVQQGIVPTTWWTFEFAGHNDEAKKEIEALFLKKSPFDAPKPIKLIKRILQLSSNKNSVILDFMAGSGTTGHAVLKLNKEDGGNRKFILCTNNENNNDNGYKIAEDICYPRIKKVIAGYKSLKGEKVEGLGGNLKYFKTDFVDAEPTDKNKIKLTEQATEMLCVKEETFELVRDGKNFKIFKDTNHYIGIIFDQAAISAFKKVIKDIKAKFSVYIFSLGDDTFDDEFKDIKQKVQLSPIPEAILRVYRRIFK